MKRFPALLAIIVLATPAVLSAAAFEGKVHMKMTESRNTHEIDYFIKEGFCRIEMDLGKGEKMTTITDQKKQEAIFLMPGQNMYMTHSLADAADAAEKATGSEGATFEKTGETEKILGYNCVKYISKSKDLTSEIWATDQLGHFMGLNSGSMGGKRKASASSAWEKALVGKDFFPMRVVTLNSKGKEQYRLETTAVEKGPQANTLFAPPPGAQKFDLGGMMKGLGLPGKDR